jgi:hypothetical protein
MPNMSLHEDVLALLTFASAKGLGKVRVVLRDCAIVFVIAHHVQADREKIDTFLDRFLRPFFQHADAPLVATVDKPGEIAGGDDVAASMSVDAAGVSTTTRTGACWCCCDGVARCVPCVHVMVNGVA